MERFERFNRDIGKLMDFCRRQRSVWRDQRPQRYILILRIMKRIWQETVDASLVLLAFWQHLSGFCLLFYCLMYLELWDMNLFLYLNWNKNSLHPEIWFLAFTACWLSILISQILSPPNSHHHIFWTTNIKADYTIQSHKIIVIIFPVHTTWLLSLTPMRCWCEQPAVVWRG